MRISTSFFALKSQHALQRDLKFTHTKNRYLTTPLRQDKMAPDSFDQNNRNISQEFHT